MWLRICCRKISLCDFELDEETVEKLEHLLNYYLQTVVNAWPCFVINTTGKCARASLMVESGRGVL